MVANLARNATTDYFPLPEAAPAASSASPHDEQPHFTFTTANTVNSEEGILKPGEEYPIYNTQDILGVLPDDLELVVVRRRSFVAGSVRETALADLAPSPVLIR